jgi:hypothetical protein
MKAILASIVLAGAVFALAGCESDLPAQKRDGVKLERGLRGQATVSPPDRADDPFVNDTTRSSDF